MSKSIVELRPDLDIVELKPGQVLLIKNPETGEDWLVSTFDNTAEAITNDMRDEDEEKVRFNYDHPALEEKNPQKTLEELI
jgi:hypothetical protein